MKQWNPFIYKEECYSLEHLNSFEWEYVQRATSNKPDNKYKFVVEFSLHCFTKGANKHQHELLSDLDKHLYYSDSRETRLFCFDRYRLSFLLPEITKSVDTRACYHTGKGNFFIVESVTPSGVKENYEVYFKITRVKKGVLRLFVQSAYIRSDDYKTSQPKKKKIGFFVIAHNTLNNKPIRVQY